MKDNTPELRRRVVAAAVVLFGIWELIKHLWLMRLEMPLYHLASLAVEVTFTVGIGWFVYAAMIRYERQLAIFNANLTKSNQSLEAANQELCRLTQLKDDLTAMIVHDLRNPLTAVLGGLQLLRDSSMDLPYNRREHLVRLAADSAEKMNQMITALLDVARLENGELPVKPSSFRLGEVFSELQIEFLLRIQQGGQNVEWGSFPGDDIVWADRTLVRRIIGNIVGNALEFTPPGGNVTVESARDADGGEVIVSVKDTGPGVPEKYREKIFDKFGTADARKQGDKVSIGLGLAFCKLAVEAQGGRIWVESEEGKGSIFHFSLPAGKER